MQYKIYSGISNITTYRTAICIFSRAEINYIQSQQQRFRVFGDFNSTLLRAMRAILNTAARTYKHFYINSKFSISRFLAAGRIMRIRTDTFKYGGKGLNAAASPDLPHCRCRFQNHCQYLELRFQLPFLPQSQPLNSSTAVPVPVPSVSPLLTLSSRFNSDVPLDHQVVTLVCPAAASAVSWLSSSTSTVCSPVQQTVVFAAATRSRSSSFSKPSSAGAALPLLHRRHCRCRLKSPFKICVVFLRKRYTP